MPLTPEQQALRRRRLKLFDAADRYAYALADKSDKQGIRQRQKELELAALDYAQAASAALVHADGMEREKRR